MQWIQRQSCLKLRNCTLPIDRRFKFLEFAKQIQISSSLFSSQISRLSNCWQFMAIGWRLWDKCLEMSTILMFAIESSTNSTLSHLNSDNLLKVFVIWATNESNLIWSQSTQSNSYGNHFSKVLFLWKAIWDHNKHHFIIDLRFRHNSNISSNWWPNFWRNGFNTAEEYMLESNQFDFSSNSP